MTSAYTSAYRKVVRFTSILKRFIAKRKKHAQKAFRRLYLTKFSKLSLKDVWNFLDSRALNAPSITHATMERYAIFNDSFCFIPLLYEKNARANKTKNSGF